MKIKSCIKVPLLLGLFLVVVILTAGCASSAPPTPVVTTPPPTFVPLATAVQTTVPVSVPSPVPSMPAVKITTSPPDETGDAITIKGLEFSPATLTVKVGTTVTWTNLDAVPHTVTSKTPSPEAFNSGALQQGQKFSHTFNQWGTYSYFCTIHTYMSGKVIVEP